MTDRRAFLTRLTALWAATVAHRPHTAPAIAARSTALFQYPDGRRNLVRVSVTGLDAPAARARLLDRRGALVGTAGLLPVAAGGLAGELWVPLSGPASFRVDVEVGRDRVAHGTVRLAAPRRWTVHLVTLLTARMPAGRELSALDAAVARLGTYPRHHWTPADAAHVVRYVAERPRAAVDALTRAIREGQIALPGLSGRAFTSLLDHETLARAVEPSARLARERDLSYATAFMPVTAGQAATLPLALSAGGVRYLMSFPDGGPDTRADAAAAAAPLCWWEGPDESRVLQWTAPPTFNAARLGLDGGIDEAAHALSEWLLSDPGLTASAWPYDVACLPWLVSDGDTAPPDAALAAVEEIRRRYAFPRVLPGRAEQFFRELEQRHGAGLPVRRGGTAWPGDARPTAADPALLRRTQLATRAADVVAVWDWRTEPLDGKAHERVGRRAEERRALWGELHHAAAPRDAGADAGPSLDAALGVARRQVEDGLSRIGRMTNRGRGRVVLNASTWDRTDVVHVPGAAGWSWSLGGDELPAVDFPDGSALHVVRSVPGLGYLAYAERQRPARPVEPDGPALHAVAGGFTVWLDAATGAIASLRDPDGRELVRSGEDGGLNQFVLAGAAPSDPPARTSLIGAQRERLPGIGVRLTAERQLAGGGTVQSTVTLYDELSWIDVANHVSPAGVGAGDLSVAFAFALQQPAVDLEIPLGRTRLTRDLASAWHAQTHWVWLTAGADGVLWSGPDTPMVRMDGDGGGTLVARVAPGPGGRSHTVRFRLSPLPPGDPAEPVRRGWAACDPLYVSPTYTNGEAGQLIARDRAVFLADRGALVLAATPADDGQGMIVRLLDVSGTSRPVGLWPAARAYRAARRASIVADDLDEIAVETDGRTTVPLRAWSVAAVRLFTP